MSRMETYHTAAQVRKRLGGMSRSSWERWKRKYGLEPSAFTAGGLPMYSDEGIEQAIERSRISNGARATTARKRRPQTSNERLTDYLRTFGRRRESRT